MNITFLQFSCIFAHKVVNLHPKRWQKVVKQPPKNIAKNCNVSDSLGHISLDFFDYDRIISLDFFNSYQIICLDYFFFVSLQRENS
jgi:hypothetical protein